MSRPLVFVSRRIPNEWVEILQESAEVEIWQDKSPASREVLLQKVKGISGMLSFISERVDGELMDAAGASLRVVGQFGVGYDNVDVPAATARRIAVGNTPGVLTETTADYAWALIMAAARRVVEGANYVHRGLWVAGEPTMLLGIDVYGVTLGIIGFGRIGQAVARRARGFNMRILYYDKLTYPQAEQETGAVRVGLDDLLTQSDFVSLHTNLNQDTFHLISSPQLAKMKKNAILINTSRGAVVDEQALYKALVDRQIAYAGLDVTEIEPISLDSPLLKLDNVIISPHIASASYETRRKMARIAAENILAGVRGQQLPFCVNPEVY